MHEAIPQVQLNAVDTKLKVENELTEMVDAVEEVFNKPLAYEWKSRAKAYWRGQFILPSKEEIRVVIEKQISGEWEVEFYRQSHKRDVTTEITGSGDPIPVFSTVIAMIKEWIHSVKPKLFFFSAKEKSRVRLYRKLLERLLTGYRVDQVDKSDGTAVFTLERK